MQVSRPDEGNSPVSLNLKILIVQVVQEADEVFLFEVEVQMVQVHSAGPCEGIIIIVDDHQDVSNYFGVVDCFGVGGIRTKGEGFVGDSGSDVDID